MVAANILKLGVLPSLDSWLDGDDFGFFVVVLDFVVGVVVVIFVVVLTALISFSALKLSSGVLEVCDLKPSVGETLSALLCGGLVAITLGLLVEITLGSGKCLVSSVGFGIGIGLNCFGTCLNAWLPGNLWNAGARFSGGN